MASGLDELFRRYSGVVFDACLRILKDRAEAEDATQETFVLAHRHLGKVVEAPSQAAWFYRVATTVCFKILRTRRRKGAVTSADAGVDTPVHPDPDGRLDASQRLRELAQALDERDFEILVAHYIHGLSQGDVADHLGISRRAVVKRLTRLREVHGLAGGPDDD